MHWETKNFISLAVLRYLLNCGGLKLNSQYLCDTPVSWIFPVFHNIR